MRACKSKTRMHRPSEHACGCRYVLADATQHSLVLVDELGKGTEVNAGAALAGAILEALDDVGCKVRQHQPPPSAVIAFASHQCAHPLTASEMAKKA